MNCNIDHNAHGTLPVFLCRTCTPMQLHDDGRPLWTAKQMQGPHPNPDARAHGRRDLPRTMDETAWAILAHIEGKKELAKQQALDALKLSQDALKAEIGEEAYKARQSIRWASKRAAEKVANVVAPRRGAAPAMRRRTTRKGTATNRAAETRKGTKVPKRKLIAR